MLGRGDACNENIYHGNHHRGELPALWAADLFPETDRESNFRIIAAEPESPWRLAVFRYWNHSIEKIECHPTSMESFEPLRGETLLLVAAHETPEDYHIFRLDQPVILEKGIWHQTLSLTESAEVKITENLEVPTDFYTLQEPVGMEAI